MEDNERKRASLFDDESSENTQDSGLNLDRFAPKKAPQLDAKVVESISKEAGFTTTHAPKKPETIKRDGRKLKKSLRTSQFNVRLKPQTAERFWVGAEKQEFEYADDFLEYLLKLYEGRGHLIKK